MGRINNRFAKDIHSLDWNLVTQIQFAIDSALLLFFRIGAVTSVMWLFVVPAIVAVCVGFVLGEVYVPANIALKRCPSIAWSPVFSHFSDTFLGAVAIRAYLFVFFELTVDSVHKNDLLPIILTRSILVSNRTCIRSLSLDGSRFAQTSWPA